MSHQIDQKNKVNTRKTTSHLDPLFRVFDYFVTEELGGNESLDAII